MAGSINWTVLATEAQAIGPLLSTIAILAAIAAGVLPPRIAGVIEQRRWRSTALRLAILLHDSIDEFAAQHGVPSQRHGQDRTLASDTLMLRALVERCEGWPADSIGDADALEAFIRLAGVGRVMLDTGAKFQGRLSREATNELLSDIDRLRTQAELQFRRFEECQRHRITV